MQLNIKPYLIILASVVIVFILFACFRGFAFEKQSEEWSKKNEMLMKVIVMVAFLIFAAAAVPVVLKLFINMQIRIGNGELPLVKLLCEHAMQVIYGAWIIFGSGVLLAIPVMIKNGLLSNTH